jgi:hypothetical protein
MQFLVNMFRMIFFYDRFNKKNKNSDYNWCGIVLKNLNKKVKKEKQNNRMFSAKEFEETIAHGFTPYYVFESSHIDAAINNFD